MSAIDPPFVLVVVVGRDCSGRGCRSDGDGRIGARVHVELEATPIGQELLEQVATHVVEYNKVRSAVYALHDAQRRLEQLLLRVVVDVQLGDGRQRRVQVDLDYALGLLLDELFTVDLSQAQCVDCKHQILVSKMPIRLFK